MKIYTKTGDKGTTSLFDGKRVPKYHLRLETYGTIDELSANLGLLKTLIESPELKNIITGIQARMINICSQLATETEKDELKSKKLTNNDISFLENQIDKLNERLEPITYFIIAGINSAEASAHICRTICRRAERLLVRLTEEYNMDYIYVVYFNRLADYLFTLARFLENNNKKL